LNLSLHTLNVLIYEIALAELEIQTEITFDQELVFCVVGRRKEFKLMNTKDKKVPGCTSNVLVIRKWGL
jgi:hypothetical protein